MWTLEKKSRVEVGHLSQRWHQTVGACSGEMTDCEMEHCRPEALWAVSSGCTGGRSEAEPGCVSHRKLSTQAGPSRHGFVCRTGSFRFLPLVPEPHLFPPLHLVMSVWSWPWHEGDIYMEITKHYKPGLCPPENWLLNTYQYTHLCPNEGGRQHWCLCMN
jgi:hypothetical protein